MIDWSRIEGFDWDDGNRAKSVEKHGVGIDEVMQVFSNSPLAILPDPRHSLGETRYHALGRADSGRELQVSFTLRGSGSRIRVISTRDMSRRERAFYAVKKAQADSQL